MSARYALYGVLTQIESNVPDTKLVPRANARNRV